MKNRFKSYGFWTALSGAVVVLLQSLGKCFGFTIDDQIVSGVIMAVAGVLVVLGVVTMPSGDKQEEETQETEKQQESEELPIEDDSKNEDKK